MPQAKREFTLPVAGAPTPQAEFRVANALEFIAHYLDRIDDHLAALVAQSQNGNAEFAKVAAQ